MSVLFLEVNTSSFFVIFFFFFKGIFVSVFTVAFEYDIFVLALKAP